MCFIDMTKAFDIVKLKDVIEALCESNVPNNLIRIVYELNANNTIRKRNNHKLPK